MERAMEDLKNMICRELDEIAQKGELSAGDLDTVYKLVVSKEKLLRAEEIEEGMEGGYSNGMDYSNGDWRAEGSYSRDGRSRRGYSRDNYSRDNSYRNGYHGRSKHYVRGHYSYDDGDMRSKMAEIMESGNLSQDQRMTIQRMMDEM